MNTEVGTVIVMALYSVAAASALWGGVYALRTPDWRQRVTALLLALLPWIIASSATRIVGGAEHLLGHH